MKKKMQWLFLTILLIGLFGCSPQQELHNEEDQLILSDTDHSQVYVVDFEKMFPYEQGQTLQYSGTAEYASVDTIERIDKIFSPKPYTLFMVEQEVEDMSGGELGDTSSFYQLKVSEDQVSYFYKEGVEQVLLMKPVTVGSQWETIRLDARFGFVPVVAEITRIENDEIKVTYVLDAAIEQAELYDRFQSITFKSNLGIIREEYGKDDNVVERVLNKTTSSPAPSYVSRYVSPQPLLKVFYKGNEQINIFEDANVKSQLWKSQASDSQRYTTFETYLNNLEKSDLRNLSRAKEMLRVYMLFTEDDFQLVESFTLFYESVMVNLPMETLLTNTSQNTYLYDVLFTYDTDTGKMVLRLENEIEDPLLSAVAGLFKKNGIHIIMLEGTPYYQAAGEFIMNGIPNEDEKVREYLAYKAREFDAFPIFSEGYLLKSAQEIGALLYDFEKAYRAYPNDEAFEEAKYYTDYFFEIFVVPKSYEYEENKYVGGYILPSFLEAYKDFVAAHPDSAYSKKIEKIVSYLDANSGRYNTTLDQYLNQLGYEAEYPMMAEALLQEKEFEGIMPVAIASKPNRQHQIEVSSLQMLLENLQPDTTLILKPGLYAISAVEAYESEYAVLSDGVLTIRDVEGVTLKGEGDQPVDLMADGYMAVLNLENTSDIVIENLRIGHRYTYCVGNVINLLESDAIWIDQVILYGCGYRGIEMTGSHNIVISNSLISDCQASALTIISSQKIAVMNTLIKRNGEQVIQAIEADDVRFENVTMSANTTPMYENQQGKFKIENTKNFVFLDNVTYDSVDGQNLIDGNGVILNMEP